MIPQARLEGRVVLVTGGARGIGRATAQLMAEEGARIAVADRDFEGALAAAQQIGGGAIAVGLDVADPNSCKQAIATVLERLGRIDVLVNNAGITRDATLAKLGDDAWSAVLSVNLTGTFLMTRAVVPHMIERGGGVVLNAASIVGVLGNFGQSNYVASKAGVIGLTRTWARELGKKGVRVNCVAPGFIATDMTSQMPPQVLDGMKAHTPLGRLGAPEDIARAYVFLASDEASFIHGQCLGVDGGLVIGT
jgi:3-oxoacyl-[acyl-carrier protein] reductase